MSELIPKFKHGFGGGYESFWIADTKPNWLVKIIHDDNKNETQIKIVHCTPNHIGEVTYVGDKGICAKKWDCRHQEKCDRTKPICEDLYPIFQCNVCKRKSDVVNFKWLYLSFIQYHILDAIENNSRIVVAPRLTTSEITKLLKGDYR